MDIDFIVQDTYALTRPQWKLATNFEEAGRAFADIVATNYKPQEPEKTTETEPVEDGLSSSEEADDDEPPVPDMDDGQSSSEEAEAEVRYTAPNLCDSLTEATAACERRCQARFRL